MVSLYMEVDKETAFLAVFKQFIYSNFYMWVESSPSIINKKTAQSMKFLTSF